MRHSTILLTVGLVLASILSPTVASDHDGDDAGRGTDAPDSADEAWPLLTGTHTGDFQENDTADWYTADPGLAGDLARWTVRAGNPGINVSIVVDDAVEHRDIKPLGELTVHLPTYARVGLAPTSWWSPSPPGSEPTFEPRPYEVTLLVGNFTDVAVDVDVTLPNVIDLAPGVSAGVRRVVEVTLTNEGEHPAHDVRITVVAHHDRGGPRHLASFDVDLAPGEERVRAITWWTHTEVGRADVVAKASHAWELDGGDNVACERIVWPADPGWGMDAGNMRTGTLHYGFGWLYAGTSSDADTEAAYVEGDGKVRVVAWAPVASPGILGEGPSLQVGPGSDWRDD